MRRTLLIGLGLAIGLALIASLASATHDNDKLHDWTYEDEGKIFVGTNPVHSVENYGGGLPGALAATCVSAKAAGQDEVASCARYTFHVQNNPDITVEVDYDSILIETGACTSDIDMFVYDGEGNRLREKQGCDGGGIFTTFQPSDFSSSPETFVIDVVGLHGVSIPYEFSFDVDQP